MSNLGFHRAMHDARHPRDLGAASATGTCSRRCWSTSVALGGEQSGHVIFRDQATTGDGLITAVRFLSLAARRGIPVGELAAAMRRFPQVLVNVEVAHKERLDDAREVWDAVRANEEALDGSGRVLVRASGTEPLVRVMVEAESEELARRHADAVAEHIAVRPRVRDFSPFDE